MIKSTDIMNVIHDKQHVMNRELGLDRLTGVYQMCQ